MPSFCFQNRAPADIGKRELINNNNNNNINNNNNNNNNNSLSSGPISREDY